MLPTPALGATLYMRAPGGCQRATGGAGPNRLLKKAQLRRWQACALAAAYAEYASLGASRAALHLVLFEQPAETGLQQGC
jgi:hypothetical protein